MSVLAHTPEPPYYAVIFATLQSEDLQGYAETAVTLEELARKQPGFLGYDSARSEIGITVSYWKDLDSIELWKKNLFHVAAKEKGKSQWYSKYSLRIAKVEIEY